MESTWETRDLPVLRAIVEIEDFTGRYVRVETIADQTGLASEQVQQAIRALSREAPPLITPMGGSLAGSTHYSAVGDATGEARRRAGARPTPENLADRIIAALEDAATHGPTVEERTRAQKILRDGKDVLKGALAGAISTAMRGGI